MMVAPAINTELCLYTVCISGDNEYGQLGYGNTDYFSDSANFGMDIDLGTDFVIQSGGAGVCVLDFYEHI